MERLISLLGRIVCLGFAYSVSYDRLDIRCNTVPWGLG